MIQASDVLTFWFGQAQLDGISDESQRRRWFTRSASFDREIGEAFGPAVAAALNRELEQWRGSLEGELALIILCDQFTRNIYRGSAQAFAGDPLALETARAVMERGEERKLGPNQRAFLGMPLEHSEDPQVQKLSAAYFDQLRRDYKNAGETGTQTESFYQYALAHQRVIEEFGRYPHRNEVLGRQSTQAELDWLANGGGF
jgi:uncharacterized protein (DUF924 family)